MYYLLPMYRLWGLGLQFGMSEVFGAIGTVSVMNSSPSQSQQTQRQGSVSKFTLPFSLIASLPEGRASTVVIYYSILLPSFDEMLITVDPLP